MACESMIKPNQTLAQRKAEVRKRVTVVDKMIAMKQVKVVVGPQGAITFTGISREQRDGMTDACIYRMITRSGSAAAKMAILKAEQLAGVQVNKKVLTNGVHSHDGGNTWSSH